MKIVIHLIFILSSTFMQAHSKGNGGLGYKCIVNQEKDNFFTLTLDIAENIEHHYSPGYFENYNYENNFVARVFSHTRELRKEYNYLESTNDKSQFHQFLFPIGYEKLQPLVLKIAANRVNTSHPILERFFSSIDLINIKNAHFNLLDKTAFNFRQYWTALDNFTEDEGFNKVNLELLAKYGLTKCKLIQIAQLQKINPSSSDKYYINQGYEYILNFLVEPMLYMDYLNLEALIWHEIIYLGLDDQNSLRTREATSQIMTKY